MKYHPYPNNTSVERSKRLADPSETSENDLYRWAMDANCHDKKECAEILAVRVRSEQEKPPMVVTGGTPVPVSVKQEGPSDNPFDPRNEVSADAKHIAGQIVKHLWIIFVLLPIVLGLLYSLLR